MKKLAINSSFILCLLFTGNASQGQKRKVGGSCSYKHIVYPAKVIQAFGDSARVFAKFEVIYDNKYKDTISYYVLNGKYITRKEATAKGVVVGAKFKYIEMHITSGACTPFIKRLTLDKYEE